MRLTMRSDYGAHAVIELARHYGDGPLQCAEIASRQKIPEAYLDQLLSSLRRVGIVRSVRGPHGGHELARPPDELTLGDVVTALEGPVVPQEFVHGAASADDPDVWCGGMRGARRLARRHRGLTAGPGPTTIQDLLEAAGQLIRARRQACLQARAPGNRPCGRAF